MNTVDRHYRACQICGHTGKTVLFDNRLAAIDHINLGYTVVTCVHCDFAYADNLASAATYTAYYRSLSKYDVAPSLAAIPQVDRDRARSAVQLCTPFLKQDAAILDLGCGSGCLLHAFQEAGWQRLAGLDPAPAAGEIARQLFGINGVISGTLDRASELLPIAQFDLVCLTGVLEHLPDVRNDIARLIDSMSPHARLFIEVPALERFTKTPCEPYGEFSLEHVQYFSCQSLAALFLSLGYTATVLQLIDLPIGSTDSIYALFSRTTDPVPGINVQLPDEAADMPAYIARSEAAFSQVVQRIRDNTASRLVIYGAGSHTARLLPRLQQEGLANRVVSIVDNNPNLHGKQFDNFAIEPTTALADYHDATIMISSFRSQTSIATSLRQQYSNPLLYLYDEH